MTRRLRAALDDILAVAPADRRPTLEHHLALLEDLAGAAARTDADRVAALVPDPSGI